jgi:hypothetical protein
MTCTIQKLDRRGAGNIVCSRREILVKERESAMESLKEALKVDPNDKKISLSIKQLKERPQQSGGGGRGRGGRGGDAPVVKEETPELRRLREKAKHNKSGQKKGGGLGDAGGMGMGLGDLKL